MQPFNGINVFWNFFSPERLFSISKEKYESLWGNTFDNIFSGIIPRIVIAICVAIAIYSIGRRKMNPTMIAVLYAIAAFFAYAANFFKI